MTITKSVERQLKVVQDSINRWTKLAIKYKNNKSVTHGINIQLGRLNSKFSQISEALQLMKSGKHFTKKGWE